MTTGGVVKSWLLAVSGEIAKKLSLTYTGKEPVKSTQSMELRNVKQKLTEEEKVAVCDALEATLMASENVTASTFAILDVTCSNFQAVPTSERRLRSPPKARARRWLQKQASRGNFFDIYYDAEIRGTYTHATRGLDADDAVKNSFTTIVEVSHALRLLDAFLFG